MKLIVEVKVFPEFEHKKERAQNDLISVLKPLGHVVASGENTTVELPTHCNPDAVTRFLSQRYGGYPSPTEIKCPRQRSQGPKSERQTRKKIDYLIRRVKANHGGFTQLGSLFIAVNLAGCESS